MLKWFLILCSPALLFILYKRNGRKSRICYNNHCNVAASIFFFHFPAICVIYIIQCICDLLSFFVRHAQTFYFSHIYYYFLSMFAQTFSSVFANALHFGCALGAYFFPDFFSKHTFFIHSGHRFCCNSVCLQFFCAVVCLFSIQFDSL